MKKIKFIAPTILLRTALHFLHCLLHFLVHIYLFIFACQYSDQQLWIAFISFLTFHFAWHEVLFEHGLSVLIALRPQSCWVQEAGLCPGKGLGCGQMALEWNQAFAVVAAMQLHANYLTSLSFNSIVGWRSFLFYISLKSIEWDKKYLSLSMVRGPWNKC